MFLKAVENVGGATDPFLKDSTIIILRKCVLHVKENIETIKKGKSLKINNTSSKKDIFLRDFPSYL